MSKAQKDGAKRRKFWKIALVSVLVLIAASIVLDRIGRAQQAKLTDGTEKYTGVQLKVAQGGLRQLRMEDKNNPVKVYDLLYVEEVRPTTPQEAADECPKDAYSSDPTKPGHYTVIISNRVQFGIKTSTLKGYGCRNAY